MTMDYSPWSEREIWPFLKVAISPKLETSHPSKLVCMHLTSTPTCMNFFSQFYLIQFFSLPWAIVSGQGNLAVFERSNISEIGEVMPTKIGVHAFDIDPYLHEFLEPILFD